MKQCDPLRHIIGTCAAQIGAISTPILSPLIIGGLIAGLDIGEVEAGGLITTELLVIGITGMAVAPLMVRIPHHVLGIAGALVLIIAQGLSSIAPDLSGLYLWRTLAGIAGGCLVATVNAAIARAASPTLLYGLAWAAGYIVTAVLAILITETTATVTYTIVYFYLAVALALILPLLWFLPRYGGEPAPAALPREGIVSGLMLMAGVMLIGISTMAYYAFLERLAVRIDATAAETGRVVAGAQVAGIIGGLMAAPVAGRLGVFRALVMTTVLHGVTIVIAVYAGAVLVLGIAAFCEAVLFIIMIPLMLTLAARIDRRGRWAAATGGVFILSTAFGPYAGALLIETAGYNAIVWLQLLATIPAIAVFLRVDRTSGKTGWIAQKGT